ncbi:MAG: hypothetical protein M3O34_07155 [Chloroflexota bacterium]|nr:hypothetical protein [Chloroflexota bacterium]
MTYFSYWTFEYAFFMGFMALLLVACVVSRMLRRHDGGDGRSEREEA